jgi:hypothetical protein
MDTVGLDVVKDIEENYAKNRKALPQEPSDLLARTEPTLTCER